MAVAAYRRSILGSLLGALLLLGPSGARAAETDKDEIELFSYTIKPGDNCRKLAFQFFGSRDRIDVLHKFNKNLGELGGKLKEHKLIPGSHLQILVPKPDARLSFVKNDVETQTPETTKGRLKQPLHKGNKVATRSDSSAELTLKTKTTLQMSDHTLLVVFGPINRKGEQGETEKAQLVSGKLRAHLGSLIGKPAPTLVVQTPAAEAVVRANSPGEASLEVTPQGKTLVTVYKGTTSVAARGKTVKVEAGFALTIVKGKAPELPKPIPVMPRWTMTPPAIILTQEAGTAHATFDEGAPPPPSATPATAPRAKVDKWHLQLSRDPAFNDLVLNSQVPMGNRTLDADRLEPGTYHARVSAIDAGGLEGPATPVASFVVARASVMPGAKRRTSTITVTPAGLPCGIDAGALRPAVGAAIVKRNAPHRLRCATGSGQEATIDLPKLSLGEVKMKVTFQQTPGTFGRGQLLIQATDPAGAPVEELVLKPQSAVAGVAFQGLKPDARAPGTYVAEVTFPLTITRLDFKMAAEDTPSIESIIVDVVAPPPPRAGKAVQFELGVAPMFALSSGALGIGGGVALELAVGFRVGPGRLIVSARPGYERYSATHAGPVPCATEGPCGFPNSSTYSYSTTENAVTIPLLALYRLERAGGRQAVYFGAGPVLTYNNSVTDSSVARNEDTRFRIGGAGLVGGQIRAFGKSSFFAEVSGRYIPLDHPALGTGTLGWLTIALGYRLAIN